MKRRTVGIVTLALGFAMAGIAAPSLNYTETWDTDDAGWNYTIAPGNSSSLGWSAFGNPGGSLQETFGPQGVPQPQTYTAYADSGSSSANFTGDYNAQATPGGLGWVVRFDFYAEDYTPSTLRLYFYSSDSGNTWTRNLTIPASTGGWNTYQSLLNYNSSWSQNFGPGSSAAFSADLSDVDQLGIQIVRNAATAGQDYYLDNFQLVYAIPEPETYMMLGFALVSLAITFRTRLRELLAGVLARVR